MVLYIKLVKQNYLGLGTKITLSINPPFGKKTLDWSNELIKEFENKLTVNREVSEVMSINYNAGVKPVTVSDATYNLVRIAVMISVKNLGFNVAIGPLAKLWKIGFDGANKPRDESIKECLRIINPREIELNDEKRSVFLKIKGMELDLGAIAKGYIADQLKQQWLSRDVRTGIIDLGGNILLVGNSVHQDRKWRIGVQNPIKPRHKSIGVLIIDKGSIGTSGIYERKLEVDGIEYHHMFDSNTGYPIKNNLASVTILSDKSIDGEICSTICFYQGIEKGSKLIENETGVEAIFITRDLKIVMTSGVKNKFYKINDQ